MSEDIKQAAQAVNEIKSAFEAFKETNDARLKEMEAKRGVDPLTEEKLARIEASIADANKIAEQAVLAAKRSQRVMVDANGDEIDLDAKAQHWARGATGDSRLAFGADDMAGYKSAFNRFLRKDERSLSGDEIKALSVGSDVDGGYLVHPDMSGQIVRKVFESSPVRAYASVQVISTDQLEGTYDDGEASVEWAGETTARAETDTPQIGRWAIPVHELTAKPLATQKLLDDAEINIEAWLAGKVAEKFAREEAAQFVTGNGVNKPRGFMDYPNGTNLRTTVEQFKTGVNAAFAAAPNGGDVLIDALYGLKAQYRANATWFMNRATTTLVRKLKDSDGAYLWSPGIAAGQPATLLGYPVASFEDMADPATGSLSIAVGDMRSAYQIVDRQGVRVLRDPFSTKPYVMFYTTKRVGGGLVNGEALKFIRMDNA